ncbi:BglG family transcription antiterminator [Oceanobacillus jeddahense]|uniref:BglG family transcription antiterminator n=1 Tax=Oceanobacillus jeddahense TaxID=1462527 RepID=UPI000693D777|nr:HTH domain-containing protein [Oceanobacillus jeddahense]
MDLDLSNKFGFLDGKARFKALFLLLLRSETYMTSGQLAAELGVTSRTIKNDLRTLKEELLQADLLITSKQSQGYKLEIADADYANRIKEFFQIYQPRTVDTEFDNRVQYILRRLLSSCQPVKVEYLQDELNVSYPLSKELQNVKEILSEYHLTLVVKPHYGMLVQGEGFKKIMLTVRVYKYFDKNPTANFGIEAYNELFTCERDDMETIRKVFYQTITQSRIVFSDIHAERFIIYLIYFRNQYLTKQRIKLDLPEVTFDYQTTEEYELVDKLIKILKQHFEEFTFSEEIIQFLTYIAVISTDLYRFRDCTVENYDTLIDLAEQTRNFILKELSGYLQIDAFDSEVCLKDLLKIMIPISLKIKLGISDCVDLGYRNIRDNHEQDPLLLHFMKKISRQFQVKYAYQFSENEEHMIFSTLLLMLNRITLDHRKLRLAIIALDGRLSTQQLKFNLQHHFSDYIERIETKVLYELDSMAYHTYDYYLCSNYGKNMNIHYSPIYFAEEGMTELEYVDSLKHIFFDAFDYNKKLPEIKYEGINPKYKFNHFPIETHFHYGCEYEHIEIPGDIHLHIYFHLSSEQEAFTIFSFPQNGSTQIGGEAYYLLINLNVNGDKQKLRMLLDILNRAVTDKERLIYLCREKQTDYSQFFI